MLNISFIQYICPEFLRNTRHLSRCMGIKQIKILIIMKHILIRKEKINNTHNEEVNYVSCCGR